MFLILGAILGALGVALGAFGAHGLKKIVPAESVATYQTGVQYQMYHVFALLILGILAERFTSSFFHYSGFFFLGGIVLFSGSLYLAVYLEAMQITLGIPSILQARLQLCPFQLSIHLH